MASEPENTKRESITEPFPGAISLPPIPSKRVVDDAHNSPARSSPLNPDVKFAEPLPHADDETQVSRSKPSRVKKDSLKKRETKSESITPTPNTKTEIGLKQSESSPLRYKLAPPKPSDFEPPRGPVMTLHHQVIMRHGDVVDFFETSDHVANKKNFRYTHCIADPRFPSMIYYRQTETEPFGPRFSFEDAASHVFFDKSARIVTTDRGFRMARANVAVREGRWYWECKITQGIRPPPPGDTKPQAGMHVRMGWARREASLDAPVGFDAYSYGIRDVAGEKVHMSRPKPFFPAGEGIREGDVIGLEIQLPSERLQRKIMAGHYHPAVDAADNSSSLSTQGPNIVRDRVPIRFKAHTYFEKIEYHTTRELEDLMNPSLSAAASAPSRLPNPSHPSPALRTLPNSCIKIYKNGVLMGTPFEDLLGFLPPASRPTLQVGAREGLDDGMLGYYPAISIFRGGAAEVNFGPDFWYPPPDFDTGGGGGDGYPGLRAVAERYSEQIAEDIVHDIIDEVDFWMQDGGGANPSGASSNAKTVEPVQGQEEIKELVEDD